MTKKKKDDWYRGKDMLLIMSLPRNDVYLARAAANSGAHALKVHLNVEHAASGTRFGTFEEEREKIQEIIDEASAASVTVGIMPGADEPATPAELTELAAMGVKFYDIYDFHMPVSYLTVKGIDPMVALGPGWRPDAPDTLNRTGVKFLEASVQPHENYGKPLVLADIEEYRSICSSFDGRVVVPTQKAIRTHDLTALRDAGVRGIMIGAIVTGREADTIAAATAEFRTAIDNL